MGSIAGAVSFSALLLAGGSAGAGLAWEGAPDLPDGHAAGLSCAQRVLSSVEARYGEPVEALSLLVYPDSAELEARNPKQPSHVDRFSCDADGLAEPEPVQAGRNQRRLEQQLFELSGTALAAVPGFLQTALDQVDTEQGAVNLVSLERSEIDTDFGESFGRPLFRVYVEGPRGGGFVEFRLDGKRGRVVRW